MNGLSNSPAQAIKEHQIMSFEFSESKSLIRNLYIDDQPWFVLSDICQILGHSNPSVAMQSLDEDERSKKSLGRQGKAWLVNESGLYALIIRSNKPQAKVFRKWVTSEVLPSIRKRGYYGQREICTGDYIDARDIPHFHQEVNGCNVRCVKIEDEVWVSINDVSKAIYANTASNQTAKKLNAKQKLARKIFIYGNTHPSWFTNDLGLRLILAGSRKLRDANQLALPL